MQLLCQRYKEIHTSQIVPAASAKHIECMIPGNPGIVLNIAVQRADYKICDYLA